jgi:hypothetical protein
MALKFHGLRWPILLYFLPVLFTLFILSIIRWKLGDHTEEDELENPFVELRKRWLVSIREQLQKLSKIRGLGKDLLSARLSTNGQPESLEMQEAGRVIRSRSAPQAA